MVIYLAKLSSMVKVGQPKALEGVVASVIIYVTARHLQWLL